MNYDEYGFPIFDDDYVDDVITSKDVNINNEQKKINIKKEDKEKPKKDKYALF